MSQIPAERQELIIQWLRDQQPLSIEALAARLNVSTMTIHRDLNELARQGRVDKVHGGVTLAERASGAAPEPQCGMCGMAASLRTTVTMRTEAEQFLACCPHCGFLMLDDLANVTSVLVRDFIYGRMVNAMQATFLLESSVSLCCVPSILAFASAEDAMRFQRGFEGRIATFAEAQHFVLTQHHLHQH